MLICKLCGYTEESLLCTERKSRFNPSDFKCPQVDIWHYNIEGFKLMYTHKSLCSQALSYWGLSAFGDKNLFKPVTPNEPAKVISKTITFVERSNWCMCKNACQRYGGTPLNNPSIDFCHLLNKSRLHF